MPDVDYYICPNCGGEVRVGGAGCPKCAKPAKKRERKPWEQDEAYDGLDLPDDEFDYDDFVAEEFGNGRPNKTPVKKIVWWTALVLFVAFLLDALVRLQFGHSICPWW